MKKFRLLALALSVPALAMAEALPLPWTADLADYSQTQFEETFVSTSGYRAADEYNVHLDPPGKSWVYDSGSSFSPSCATFTTGLGRMRENNYLISPELSFPTAGKYKLTVRMKFTYSSNTGITFRFGHLTEPVEETALATDFPEENQIGSMATFPTSETTFEYLFNVSEPGDYNIALNNAVFSNSAYKTYTFYGMSVEQVLPLPIQISNLKAEADGDGVMLSWTNPRYDIDNNQLTSLSKVVINRDGEAVATLDNVAPGESMTYTDFPPQGATYKYQVIAYNEYGAAYGDPMTVSSPWVGDKLQTLPWQTQFRNESEFGLFTIVDLDNNGRTWKISTTGLSLPIKSVSNVVVNDVVYTPPFECEPGYYRMRTNMGGGRYGEGALIMGISKEEDMATGEFLAQETKEFGSYYSYDRSYDAYFKVEEKGRYVFGIKADMAFSGSPSYDFTVSQIYVEDAANKPDKVTDISVTPGEDMALEATISWMNPSTCNIPGAEPDIREIKILRKPVAGGAYEQIASLTEMPYIEPGKRQSYVDTSIPRAGEYYYVVEIYGDGTSAYPQADQVKSAWIGGGMKAPYTADFNEWTIINSNGDGDTDWWGDIDEEYTWTVSNSGDQISYEYSDMAYDNADDWAISPRMEFEAGKSFTITFEAWGTVTEGLSIWWGSAATASGMKVKLGDVVTPEESEGSQVIEITCVSEETPMLMAEEEEQAGVEVPAGIGYLGIHADGEGDYYLKNLKFEAKGGNVGVETVSIGMEYSLVGRELYLATCGEVKVLDTTGAVVLVRNSVDRVSLAALPGGIYILVVNGNTSKVVL